MRTLKEERATEDRSVCLCGGTWNLAKRFHSDISLRILTRWYCTYERVQIITQNTKIIRSEYLLLTPLIYIR